MITSQVLEIITEEQSSYTQLRFNDSKRVLYYIAASTSPAVKEPLIAEAVPPAARPRPCEDSQLLKLNDHHALLANSILRGC